MSVGRIASQPVSLRRIKMLAHSVFGYGQKGCSQAVPFLLAERERADIVSAIPMTIKKLHMGRCPNGILAGSVRSAFWGFHEMTEETARVKVKSAFGTATQVAEYQQEGWLSLV